MICYLLWEEKQMKKENYNQIRFTAVRDNFLSGYFYTQKVTLVEN